MRWPDRKIVAAQFLFYTIGGLGAFIAWVLIQLEEETLLLNMAGYYLTYHFRQWTMRLYLWGPIVLVSAFIALVALWFILKRKKLGGYLGIVAVAIGLIVDILVANIMFVHILVGLLIGWVLLSPVVFGWDDLFNVDESES
ncbi:MAG: hypothetical protein ACFFFO_11040 [Candidatus Thorarchaeota archaeon]